jgi:adenosylmethionine-8-amino-7-oxononanoate aminotransferase
LQPGLDATSGAISVVSVGHGRAEVSEAMEAQARQLAYVQHGRFRNQPASELARRLAEITPGDLNRFFFCTGGSEANDSVIKLARQYQLLRGRPERHVLLSRQRSYHGNTLGALTLSGHRVRRAPYLPLLGWEPAVAECNPYRPDPNLSGPDYGRACANDLERAINEVGPDTVSGFIAEPIVAAAGAGTMPPPGYFERVREICDAYDILFVVDEVVTGFGRTGKWFGIQHWDAVPDVIVTAKGIAGGYAPLAAMIVSERVERVFLEANQPFLHGYTYQEHPVGCAAALAVLDILQREELVANAARQGEYLFERLHHLAEDFPIIGDVRGAGLLAGIELVANRRTKEPLDPNLAATECLSRAALDHGIMLYPCQSGDGHGDQFILSPPLIVTPGDVDFIVDRLGRALVQIQEEVRPRTAVG